MNSKENKWTRNSYLLEDTLKYCYCEVSIPIVNTDKIACVFQVLKSVQDV